MKAYKGFRKLEDGRLMCRYFQYEVGKTYTFDGKPVICEQGFHACHEPWQCWPFYPNNGENVYYEVECGGKIVESNDGDGKFVCTEITLVREIPEPENKVDDCWYFRDGYAMVELKGKWNFIDTDGRLLSEQWWDDCGCFSDGYAKVELNGKFNYINTEGKYLSEQWWDDCWNFSNGYASVKLDGKWNFIDTKGKYLSEQWWDWCGDFRNGYAVVKLDGKWNCINTEGSLISEQWWDCCLNFRLEW